MLFPFVAVISGLVFLVWSADRFVEGSAATARHYGMPPLLVGMVIVGFGTSAPEMVVSVISAYHGNSGISLGNAYGSNITNIALILGLTALISPVVVHSQVLRRELPILTAITIWSAWLLSDGMITRIDSMLLLGVFAVLMSWTIRQGLRKKTDALGSDMQRILETRSMPIGRAVFRLVLGLVLLIASSRLLLWGAVKIAHSLGVSDLIIGLTIVATGTSLPELASSVLAARRGEPDIAVGNILGSNLFNTLAVVGIAGTVNAMRFQRAVLVRDIPVMTGLTVSLFIICYGFKGRPGQINRIEGAMLLTVFTVYTLFLILTARGG